MTGFPSMRALLLWKWRTDGRLVNPRRGRIHVCRLFCKPFFARWHTFFYNRLISGSLPGFLSSAFGLNSLVHVLEWGMQCCIYAGKPRPQLLDREWFGRAVEPPFSFSFSVEGGELVFRAGRAAASLSAEAGAGLFAENLWHRDVAEFFVASPAADRYIEFNLSPRGAWWACLFAGPREALPAQPAPDFCRASGVFGAQGWDAQARVPLAFLEGIGLPLASCRLAVAAILESPEQIFLTTAPMQGPKPDFHRPWDWMEPIRCLN